MPTRHTLRLLVPLAALLLTTGLHAQLTQQPGLRPGTDGPPMGAMRGTPPSPQMELARMTQQFTLTDAQQAAILPILTQRRAAMDDLRKNGGGTATREANMQQMKVIRDSTNAQIRPLLTPAQAKLFDTMQPQGPPGGGPQTPIGGNNTESNPSTGTPPPPAPPQ